MPRGDRTGPQGMGAMTGRGAGFCAGFNTPGYTNQALGRGVGFGGRGMGFGGRGRGVGFGGRGVGWGNQWAGMNAWQGQGVQAVPYQSYDAETERQVLKNQAEILQAEMTNIQKRLDEMDSDSKSD